MNTPHQLRTRADLLDAWDKFEIGLVAPGPLAYAEIATMLRDAAQRIEELESDQRHRMGRRRRLGVHAWFLRRKGRMRG